MSILARSIFRAGEAVNGLLHLMPAALHAGHITCKTIVRPFCVASCMNKYVRPIDQMKYKHKDGKFQLPTWRIDNLDPDTTDLTVVSPQQRTQELTQRVNTALENREDVGRLFAVVQVTGLQRKVTTEDILVISGTFHPNIGDKIRLEKVLMAGGKNFTLVGRPLLSRDLVKVEATVIEKTLSHVKVKFNYIRRKRYRKFKLLQTPNTMLVINSIELNPLPGS
ncbi:hypothetical protein CHS0354_020294 [Potamilus streckersoni]|uniref:Large ribosomal subunit protein bL21m n=1 Tax=Potamilus streckersoni TaxID=2493646 RepID=A0AAE0S5H3_9BIVA|nr:hypothetical protein CHS0354_020294 [Potamilus streckersoni]